MGNVLQWFPFITFFFCLFCFIQTLLWREDWSLFCVVGLVHWHVNSCSPGGCFCLPVWTLHHGLKPSQVSSNTESGITDNLSVNQRLRNAYSETLLIIFWYCVISKEICEANTTIMCPMCEETCEPWTLSDSCVYAKVSIVYYLLFPTRILQKRNYKSMFILY